MRIVSQRDHTACGALSSLWRVGEPTPTRGAGSPLDTSRAAGRRAPTPHAHYFRGAVPLALPCTLLAPCYVPLAGPRRRDRLSPAREAVSRERDSDLSTACSRPCHTTRASPAPCRLAPACASGRCHAPALSLAPAHAVKRATAKPREHARAAWQTPPTRAAHPRGEHRAIPPSQLSVQGSAAQAHEPSQAATSGLAPCLSSLTQSPPVAP